jgi:hypothetical protein
MPGERGERGERGDRPYRGDRPEDRMGGEGESGAPEEFQPATAEEWEDIREFMEANCPNRWAFFQAIKDTRPRATEAISRRIVERFRWLKRVEANQKLYNTAVAQAKAEDEVWGLLKKVREEDNPATRAALREKVTASVQQNLKDREEKLARLREAVAREQETLAADRLRIEQLIDNQMDRLTSDNPFSGPPQGSWAPPGMRRRDGGGGERRPPEGRDTPPTNEPPMQQPPEPAE